MASFTMLFVKLVVLFFCVSPSLARTRDFDEVKSDLSLRVELLRRDYKENLTTTESLRRGVERSIERLQKFRAQVTKLDAGSTFQTDVTPGEGEFLMKIGIGTPASTYEAILDTGSDLTWTQCQPCQDCFTQSSPIFNPKKSTTFATTPCRSTLCRALPQFQCAATQCQYFYQYGDYSFTSGYLATDTFTLSSQKLSQLTFGCGQDNEGNGFSQGAGLVGFGRGPLSLISQLGTKKFSYCLTSVGTKHTSPLFLGSAASTSGAVSTPLIRSTMHPTFYYLSLQGVSIGALKVAIPKGIFDLQSDGTGGLIIDSGTTITYLEQAAYNKITSALSSAVKLTRVTNSQLGLDLCFKSPARGFRFPDMTLSFAGGANMVLPAENYLIQDSSAVICLAMLPSNGMSILGNIQQQNFHIVYDTGASALSFARTSCGSL